MTTPPLDLPAMRAEVAHNNSRKRVNGIYSNDAIEALIARVEEADGLLSRLSASGGRNIDLLKRAEAAERDLAAVTVSRDGWQTRAEAAEKAVAKVQDLADHYAALADSMPKPHGIVTRTQSIFVRDLRQALDTHTPETETTP